VFSLIPKQNASLSAQYRLCFEIACQLRLTRSFSDSFQSSEKFVRSCMVVRKMNFTHWKNVTIIFSQPPIEETDIVYKNFCSPGQQPLLWTCVLCTHCFMRLMMMKRQGFMSRFLLYTGCPITHGIHCKKTRQKEVSV
jgi:hypothetical protein